jgi:nitroimidazol reductase NimA-like FMN-containing flavoprotein (pyridoxamine 5'-phosphate oxidase superfamily)
VYETVEDLAELQRVLDASYASAGPHLLSIHTPDRRMTAEQLSEKLTGVRILALATVAATGEPVVGPVDGLFYRGRFWFGSSPDSVRFRHIRERPSVSAAHTVGEELAVVVHGTAREVDVGSPELAGFREYLIEVYGPQWETWWPGAAPPYAVIEPRRMFTFLMDTRRDPASGDGGGSG